MPTKRLYLQPIPEGAQLEDQDTLQSNLSAQGLLDGGSAVEQLSNQPGDHTLRGQYRAQSAEYGELMARELREIANAAGFDAVPLYRTSGESSDDGYYVIERADQVGPVRPQQPAIQQFRLSLSEDGTKSNRWRAVESERFQADHPYGNDLNPLVAIPAGAGKPQWFNPDTGARASATATSTVASEHGDVERYSLDDGESAVGTADPTLIYELSYAAVGPLDPVVWDAPWGDPYGDEYGTGYGGLAPKLNDGGVRQWQHVFTTSHEYQGVPVLDSGRLRVFCFEASGELAAQTWDDAASEWNSVGLDWSGDWSVFDVDLSMVSPTVIAGQFTFENTSSGELFALDGILARGAESVLWHIPPNETGPIPSGLESVLEPIASTRIEGAQPRQTLVSREEVRR